MTIQTTTGKVAYIGNGVTVDFAVPFRFFANSNLVVVRQNLAGTTGVVLILDSGGPNGYSVTGAEDPEGGEVTVNLAPTAQQQIVIRRVVPITQLIDFLANDPFPEESSEFGLDKLTAIAQQLLEGSMQLILDEDGTFVWDAQGHRLINLGAGINPTDAVNLGQVLELIEEGGTGGISVTPRVYQFVGEDGETDFFMEGADVADPAFYDSYIEQAVDAGDFVALRPLDDFTVEISGTGAFFRFGVAPEDGIRAFTVLRGYARPYTGPTPITSTALNVRITSETAETLDTADHYGLIGTTETDPVTLTIRENTGAANDWLIGQFFSVVPLGTGAVTIAGQGAVNLIVPPGFEPKPRGTGCVISATCVNPDQGDWLLSGDLLRTAVEPNYILFTINDRSALSGTNIVTGTNKGNYVVPFDMRLRPIADKGLYGSLMVAQAAGAVFTVDVNRNGTSIISTKLTWDNTEQTTITAATPAVYAASGDLLAEGDIISIDVDQVGTALAKGVAVHFVAERI